MPVSYNLKNTNLFNPIKLGSHILKHRVLQAPTTRSRATIDAVPTDLMLEYYGKRAKASAGGLVITEGTFVSKQASGWKRAPGIYTKQQAEAWKIITDKVHETDTKICCQLWFIGRVAKPAEMKRLGLPVVAPSLIYSDDNPESNFVEAGNELKALTLDEIEQLKKDFVNSAKLAIDTAGFDFVEIHSANGYLLDQFIHPCSNQRTDKYGGSVLNHARLCLEIVDLLCEAVGKDKVGIRLSPWGEANGMKGVTESISPVVNFGYLVSELNKRDIAFVHLLEAKLFIPDDSPKTLLSDEFIYQVFNGPIIRSGNYSEKINRIEENLLEDRTLISFGRHYLSNPDLPLRLKNDWELTPCDFSTAYTHTNYGYNTFANHGEELTFDVEQEKQRYPKLLL